MPVKKVLTIAELKKRLKLQMKKDKARIVDKNINFMLQLSYKFLLDFIKEQEEDIANHQNQRKCNGKETC